MRRPLTALLLLAAVAFVPSAASAQVGGGLTEGCLYTVDSGEVPEMARGEGSTPREPELRMTYQELPDSAKGKGKKWSSIVTVPVWFHVVHDNGVGNVSDADIARQIRIMNNGYSGAYGGYDQGFRFELVGVTRTNNAEWYNAGPTTPGERAMKQALRRGDMGTLNYYSTTAGPYLGWAYYPGLPDATAYLDGLVVDWESMYKTSDRYAGRYDLGFTAVHEVGHWFALAHTFDGGCNAHGDHVDDTPAMKVPTSGCPADGTKDTCPRDPGFDPIHNFMDYSTDYCYEELTQGQAERSRDYWLEFRA
ncbi:MAG: zinc metalloprotease [Micromonosporaceae bacterium]